jgi:phage gpG-like protein
MSSEATLNMKKFNQIMKALEKVPTIRVGILGNSNARNDGNTNAEIGAKHEFGKDGMPERSFLRMPMTTEFPKALEGSQLFDAETLKKVAEEKSTEQWARKIATVAEGVVQEAFSSRGFGNWKPHAPGYENHTGQVLVDTQQLRNSITSEVKIK